MKKYFLIICLLLTCFLTSCSVKNEIEEINIEGNKIPPVEAYMIKNNWYDYIRNYDPEDDLFLNWYDIEMKKSVKTISKEGNSDFYVNLTGKICESYYSLETKMKLNLQMERINYDDENNIKEKISTTVQIIHFAGKSYYGIKMKEKFYFENGYSHTKKTKKLIVGVLDKLSSVVNIRDDVSIEYQALYEFDQLMNYIVDKDEESKGYQKDDTYFYEKESEYNLKQYKMSEKTKEQVKIQMGKHFNVEQYETYKFISLTNKNYFSEKKYSLKLKKSQPGIIMIPFNYMYYTQDDYEKIIISCIEGF